MTSFGDVGIAKLRRHKDADSRNAWTARSDRRDEVWAQRQEVSFEEARGGMIE